MKTEEIRALFETFEGKAHHYGEVECWSARDMAQVMGYERWENFSKVIEKARLSCQNASESVADHFREVTKMVQTGSGASRSIEDTLLTRYACYLIAQNGDPKKQSIAFAQTYFAAQTRKAELIEQRLLEIDRVQAREKLASTEKQLNGVLYERGVDSKGFARIRSMGDQALFKLNTQELKNRMGIPEDRPLADFLPTLGIKAKDFAAEMTKENVKTKDLHGVSPIENEHVDNNKAVREMLIQRGIKPENWKAEEDIKKVESAIKAEHKAALKPTKKAKTTKKGSKSNQNDSQ